MAKQATTYVRRSWSPEHATPGEGEGGMVRRSPFWPRFVEHGTGASLFGTPLCPFEPFADVTVVVLELVQRGEDRARFMAQSYPRCSLFLALD